MSDRVDLINYKDINRKTLQNKQLLTKVLNEELKIDCSFKEYLIKQVKNGDYYTIMCVRNFIIKNCPK